MSILLNHSFLRQFGLEKHNAVDIAVANTANTETPSAAVLATAGSERQFSDGEIGLFHLDELKQ